MAIYATGIVIWRARQMVQAGGALTRTAVALFELGPTATLLFWANAFVFGSVAIYALALCIHERARRGPGRQPLRCNRLLG